MFEENGTIVGRSACVRPVSHVNGARIDGGPDRGQSRRCEADEDSSAGRDDVVVTPEPLGLMLGIVQNGPTQMVSGNIYESLLRYNEKLEKSPTYGRTFGIYRPKLRRF